MADKKCLIRPGKIERRTEEIVEAIKVEILKASKDLQVGGIQIDISILNGGIGHCKISNSRMI